ncbi:von willebrand factor type egf and pentraxin domain-containing protein 1 [Lasius niger]|uniref:von willebrand factor type egf and pentraxin domain-containing protein 1 n=1 Tax=Lasius niger TaxID=67767 RepID=A0A0J7JVW9_LASNI|nr:von willebrand factor type egf and pentraxin domain-containing protein 1 [Lasius niger]
MSCSQPIYIDHAIQDGFSYLAKRHVRYTCEDGYVMMAGDKKIDDYTIYCLPGSLTWSVLYKNVHCRPIECPDLEPPENGRVSYRAKRVGSIASYACDRNFRLSGTGTRRCGDEGTWIGEAPTCERIYCHENPSDRFLPDRPYYEAGIVVVRACEDKSRHVVKCLDTGFWNKYPCRDVKREADSNNKSNKNDNNSSSNNNNGSSGSSNGIRFWILIIFIVVMVGLVLKTYW